MEKLKNTKKTASVSLVSLVIIICVYFIIGREIYALQKKNEMLEVAIEASINFQILSEATVLGELGCLECFGIAEEKLKSKHGMVSGVYFAAKMTNLKSKYPPYLGGGDLYSDELYRTVQGYLLDMHLMNNEYDDLYMKRLRLGLYEVKKSFGIQTSSPEDQKDKANIARMRREIRNKISSLAKGIALSKAHLETQYGQKLALRDDTVSALLDFGGGSLK